MSLARSDFPGVAQAVAAWRADDLLLIRRLNNGLLQTRETSELRAQTGQMGCSSVETKGMLTAA